jgi:hypothetical protein
MDAAYRTPLVDCFRRGEVARDIRLLAAAGGVAPRAHEQVALLMLLVDDADPEVAATAEVTLGRLPAASLAAFLARADVSPEVREFFARRGAQPGERPAERTDIPLLEEPDAVVPDASSSPVEQAASSSPAVQPDSPPPVGQGASSSPTQPDSLSPAGQGYSPAPADAPEEDEERKGTAQRLASMNVSARIKVAMQGTREERSVLIRDPNRLVSSAVLSSPKLTESEVEAIARMANVSDEVLRIVGTTRNWVKNYNVIAALTRNAKTPIAISLGLLNRLVERDIKMLASDRNIPEPIRVAARKLYVHNQSRRQ